MKDWLEKYLRKEPLARERRNKDRGIVNLLREKYPILKDIPKETLIATVQDFNSLDRYWRMILSENEELQGKDYCTKRIVEERKEMELGYESGFHQFVKNL